MIWYNQGTHIKLDGLHILCDPTFTTDEHPDWESYLKIRKEAAMNTDYSNVDLIVVSHGHADHCDRLDYFSETQVTVLAHPMTMDLKAGLFSNFENAITITDGESVDFKGVKITALSSGHCGGSIMFLFKFKDHKILFTGDLNTQIIASTYPARPVKCDVLIMEATFGDPKYDFPPRDVINKNMYDYFEEKFQDRDVIIMFGQALGKVQDVIKTVRGFRKNDIKIFVDGYSYMCTQIYETYYGKINHEINHFDNDLDKPPKQSYAQIHEAFNPKNKTLVLCHMSKETILEDIPKICKRFGLVEPPVALMSGLGKEILQPIIDMYDPAIYKVSNHSDYTSLVHFAQQCQAKKVCVFHGRSKIFKDEASKELDVPVYYLHGERCELD